MNWKITDRLEFQQSFYAEIWDTVNPNFSTIARPIETLQHSRGNAALDGNYGSQLTWTLSNRTLLTGRYNITQGGSNRIGFFEDLATPQHRDQITGIQTGNFTATRFRPRRDEVSVKLNTSASGAHEWPDVHCVSAPETVRPTVYSCVPILPDTAQPTKRSFSLQPGGLQADGSSLAVTRASAQRDWI